MLGGAVSSKTPRTLEAHEALPGKGPGQVLFCLTCSCACAAQLPANAAHDAAHVGHGSQGSHQGLVCVGLLSPDARLCMCSAVVSKTTRTLDVGAAAFLSNMAELCVTKLEKKWALSTPHTALLQRPVAAYHACVLLLDTSKPGWPVLLSSSAAAHELGARGGNSEPRPTPAMAWLVVWSVCAEPCFPCSPCSEILPALLVVQLATCRHTLIWLTS